MAVGLFPMASSARFRAGKCSKSRSSPLCWFGACLTLAACVAPAAAYEPDRRYLFITAPETHNVYYVALPNLKDSATAPEDADPLNATVLINGAGSKCVENSTGNATCTEASDQGLDQPEGITVWHGKESATLFVADAAQQKIFKYPITGTPSYDVIIGGVTVGAQSTVAEGLTGLSGIAMDGYGNLYFTTTDGTVGMVASDQWNLAKPATTILYKSESQKAVSNPLGIAANSFHVFWTNSENGANQGVVVKAFERDAEANAKKYPDYPMALAKNVGKAMGVCLAQNNVFYTGEAQYLYGVKTSGGSIAEVYSAFKNPRGCAFDGENTLFVADQQEGAVYSLPANFPTLRPMKTARKVATVASPSGVAVFTSAPVYSTPTAETTFWQW